jgi:hypothetical protein
MIGIGVELGDPRVIHHPKPFSPSRLIEEVETLTKEVARLAPPSEWSACEWT